MPCEYVFVLGTGRCGSTLVQEVLARHPDVGFVSNLDDRYGLPPALGRWNNALYRRVPQALTRKGRARFAPSEAYRLLERRVSPALVTPFRDLTSADADPWLARRLRAFFDDRAAAQGKPVFLHKFTGWPRAGFIRAVFPDARFVHIVRDGRAVANSWLQMPWYRGYGGPEQWQFGPLPDEYREVWEKSDRSHAVLAALGWRMLMDAFAQARVDAGDERWLELRYEDVVDDPSSCFGRMRGFCRLPTDARFDDTVRNYQFDRTARDAFRRDLDEGTIELLDGALGEVLDLYGYGSGR